MWYLLSFMKSSGAAGGPPMHCATRRGSASFPPTRSRAAYSGARRSRSGHGTSTCAREMASCFGVWVWGDAAAGDGVTDCARGLQLLRGAGCCLQAVRSSLRGRPRRRPGLAMEQPRWPVGGPQAASLPEAVEHRRRRQCVDQVHWPPGICPRLQRGDRASYQRAATPERRGRVAAIAGGRASGRVRCPLVRCPSRPSRFAWP